MPEIVSIGPGVARPNVAEIQDLMPFFWPPLTNQRSDLNVFGFMSMSFHFFIIVLIFIL
jgi:hypothetical protein